MNDPYAHLSTLAKTRISSRVCNDDWKLITNLLPFRGSVNLLINAHVKRIADYIRRTNITYTDILADPNLLTNLLLGSTVGSPTGDRRSDDGQDDGRGTGSSGRRPARPAGTARPKRKAQRTSGEVDPVQGSVEG